MTYKHLILGFAGLAGSVAFGETWCWSPTVKTDKGYNWTEPQNWLNSSNERGVGYPNTGDTAVLGDTASSSGTACYAPNGSSRKLYELRIGPGKVVTMNQGDYGFQAGGRGFQFLATSGTTGNWGGMRFSGDGDVPINIANNVVFAMQMRMQVDSGSPALVKEGQGEFICYNQGSSDFSLKEVRVKKGAIDCSSDGGSISNCRFMFDGNDASQRFMMGYSNHKGLKLNNCGLYETNGVDNTGHGFDDRGKKFQVTFSGAQKLNPTVFSGRFYRTTGLNWNPSSADAVFVCSNAVSDTAGIITVAKGTVRLVTGASFTSLAELQVSAGATFDVAGVPSAAFRAATLTLAATTSKIKVGEGVNLTFTTGTLAGKALKPGVYSAAGGEGQRSAVWIEGAGTVTVEDGPANSDTWTGSAADTSILQGGNWESGEEPDLTSGSFFATFAAGGSVAALPAETSAKFDGIVLENTTGASVFSFSAGENAAATLGLNGFKGLSAAATTWNMGWPLLVDANQTWAVGANDTLVVAGGLSGTRDLTLDGAGTVTFASESTHSGALSLKSGTVRVTASNGLGTNDREVQFQNDKANLCFAGDIEIDSPMYGKTSSSESSAYGFTIEPNANVVFNGKVRQYATCGRVTVGAGATVTFKGGYGQVLQGMSSTLSPRGSGTIVVEENPMSIGFAVNGAAGHPVTFDLRVAGNAFNSNRRYSFSMLYGPLYTRVKNALAVDQSWLCLNNADAVWHLCGADQSVSLFHGKSGSRVVSDEPATLTIAATHQNTPEQFDQDNGLLDGTNRVDLAVFEGPVSVRKTGEVKHTFGVTSPTTGSLEVKGGPVVFNANGKWPNCSSVTVSDTGTLILQNAEPFNEKATVSVMTDKGAKLQLDAVNVKCDRLYVNGRRLVGGLYGAAGSGAAHEVSWITGNGALEVAEHGHVLYLK